MNKHTHGVSRARLSATSKSYWLIAMSSRLRIYKGFILIAAVLILLVLSSCSFPGVVSTSEQLPRVHSTPQAQQFPPVRFPQDEAAHNDLTEWWYYTGHLNATDPNGKPHHYGFELVIFQALRSDFPPVYASHFAISDVTRGEFHYDQRSRVEPEAVIPNGKSTSGINVSVGDWSIRGVNGQDHLKANMANYTIDLNLLGLKPPTLHNGNGLITYGVAGFSYYYSRTRMTISGLIDDHNHSLPVTGEAWMDHQWGNFLSLGGGGWDWYSMQLKDNTEIMLYFIHDASGKTLSTYASYINASAEDRLIAPASVRSTALGHWKSPKTGANYPSGWRVEINDPHVHLALTLTPELKNQELVVYQSTGNSYWEGAITIQGTNADKAVQGEGYVELTGYAGAPGSPQT